MAKIFCIANQKGGVGKTTTSVNLAAGLARIGQRVLLIDLDPQGNATMGSGVNKRELALSIYDVLLGEATIAEAAVNAEACGYRVLGANRELAGAEIELVGLDQREQRLKQALAVVATDYDFVRWSGHLLQPGGRMLALKGQAETTQREVLPDGWKIVRDVQLKVPGMDAERHVLQVERSAASVA